MLRWLLAGLGIVSGFLAQAELRVVTWNVAGNGLTNWTTDMAPVQAVGRILQHLKPDVVTLQEIPNENNAYTRVEAFTRTYLPGYTNFYSHGTDGFLRSAILSRHPVNRVATHLDGVSLASFGNAGRFTRDLFETEVAVPGLATPLHVFTTHLKAGGDAASIAVRAAEASAISNFLARTFPALHPGRPFVLTGDLNEDVAKPRDPVRNPLPRLVNSSTGLTMLNATNPVTLRSETWSARFSLNTRFDYILASPGLFTNVTRAITFRSDRVSPLPEGLFVSDSAIASDHLPVLAVIDVPGQNRFRVTDITTTAGQVTLTWEGDPGTGYRVERSADFRIWVQATATRATNRMTFPPGAATEFYRVVRAE